MIDRKVPATRSLLINGLQTGSRRRAAAAPFGSGYRYRNRLDAWLQRPAEQHGCDDHQGRDRMHTKLEQAKDEITLYENTRWQTPNTSSSLTAAPLARRLPLANARAKGIKAGLLKLITIWPSGRCCEKSSRKAKTVIVPK